MKIAYRHGVVAGLAAAALVVLAGVGSASAATAAPPTQAPVASKVGTDLSHRGSFGIARPAHSGNRCFAVSNGNNLCIDMQTDFFGNWTQATVSYEKNSGPGVWIRLGYNGTDGESGSSTNFFIAAHQIHSVTWNLTPPGAEFPASGVCFKGTMQVQGQGFFDTLPQRWCVV